MGMYEPIEVGSRSQRTFSFAARVLGALKLDGPLLIGLGLITVYGFVILYSASGQSWNRVADAAIRAALGGFAMCALAQVSRPSCADWHCRCGSSACCCWWRSTPWATSAKV